MLNNVIKTVNLFIIKLLLNYIFNILYQNNIKNINLNLKLKQKNKKFVKRSAYQFELIIKNDLLNFKK